MFFYYDHMQFYVVVFHVKYVQIQNSFNEFYNEQATKYTIQSPDRNHSF